MQRKSIFLIMFILMSLITTSCTSSPSTNKIQMVENQSFYMGTIITDRVYGENAQKASDAAMNRIKEIEASMTINAAGGDVNKLNSEAGKSEVKLSPDVIYVLETAKKFAALSEGTFDVTIGPLVKEWGIFTDHPKVPTQDEINNLKKLVDFKDLYISSKESTAKLAKAGQIVDLGGIAKGYAGDEAIRIFKEKGIKSALINLGGNMVVLGGKPDGSPWKIGVQNPRAENGKYIGILEVKDKAVVSSGDYERFFEKDGERYHHIIDSRTGYPSDSGLIGTTIISDKSIDGDALSTSTFVLGLEKGMKLIESLPGVEAVFVTKDKKVYTTRGLKGIFKFDDESKEFEYVEKG